MKNVRSLLNETQLNILDKDDIVLSDDKDYSDDELFKIYETIIEKYLDNGFKDDEPTELVKTYEEIINIFQKHGLG